MLEGINVGSSPLVCPNIVECLPRGCNQWRGYLVLLVGRGCDLNAGGDEERCRSDSTQLLSRVQCPGVGYVRIEESNGGLEEWSEGGKTMSVLLPRWLLTVN